MFRILKSSRQFCVQLKPTPNSELGTKRYIANAVAAQAQAGPAVQASQEASSQTLAEDHGAVEAEEVLQGTPPPPPHHHHSTSPRMHAQFPAVASSQMCTAFRILRYGPRLQLRGNMGFGRVARCCSSHDRRPLLLAGVAASCTPSRSVTITVKYTVVDRYFLLFASHPMP